MFITFQLMPLQCFVQTSCICFRNLKLKTQVFPAGTDSRYIREVGLPAIGFSPINKTPILLHDHDEYLGKTTFLRGIEIYCLILSKVANVEDRTG